MDGLWLLEQLHPQAPGLWLGLSIFSGVLLALAWGHLPTASRRQLVLARWLLLPYLGLLSGGLSLRLMGITDIDWLRSLSLGSTIVFLVLIALALVRMAVAMTGIIPTTALPAASLVPPTSLAAQYLRRCIYGATEEWHWCFLRGACWELVLSWPVVPTNPAYTAVWLAAILAAPEAFIFPFNTTRRLANLISLLATTILFFYARN